MKAALIALSIVFALSGCSSKSDESTDSLPETKKDKPKDPEPAPETKPVPPPEPKADAAPEPKTPEEIELARKAAFMDGRDEDAIKYCEMGGTEAGKSDPQVLLGCTLAACRAKKVEKAREWAKSLPKALGNRARQICRSNGVTL